MAVNLQNDCHLVLRSTQYERTVALFKQQAMNENLIEAQTFTALKRYLVFLSEFPGILEQMKLRSDEYKGSGHELFSPLDIQALMRNAASNETHWRSIVELVPVLGIMGNRIVEQTYHFLQEFEHEVKKLSHSAKTNTLKDLPHQNFTPITSGTHTPLNHSNIKDLINNLGTLVEECAFTSTLFSQMLMEDSNTTHSFFAHFIDSLLTPICLCHPSVSKLSIYYHDELLNSVFSQTYLTPFLKPLSTANNYDSYLKALSDLHVSARQAGSDLRFLCSSMLLFFRRIDTGLKSNSLQTTLRLASTSFIQITSLLEGLKETSHALTRLSSTLQL